MKKVILSITLTLLLVAEGFGQAAVDISLVASTLGYNYQLQVGLDLTASNCIDPQLGESDLPSPPPGVTEIRFDLYPYGCGPVSTYVDYRAPGSPPVFPFSGVIEHTLIYMLSTPASPIDIIYDIPPGAFITIQDEFGGVILNLGPFTGQGTTTIPGSYTNSLSSALILMEYTNILPVELTSFTASVLQYEHAVQLNWATSTETNNSGFEILRFTQNDNEWSTIGFVPGFGTTTEPKTYSIIDEDITTGDYKYRLKQIDFDGTFEYSNEIEVEVDFTPKEFVLYQNYPNPFNPSTTIKYSLPIESNVRIKIFNAIGEVIENLVSETQPAGTHNVVWNAQNQSSGIYYYSFEVTSSDGSQSHREMKKIVLLK